MCLVIGTKLYGSELPILTLHVGDESKDIPLTIYNNDTIADLTVLSFNTGPEKDNQLLHAAIHTCNALHNNYIDMRYLERIAFNEHMHNNTVWWPLIADTKTNEDDIEKNSIDENSDFIDWPAHLRDQKTTITVQSYVNLSFYPNLAESYSMILEKLFTEKPVLDMRDIVQAMTLQNVRLYKRKNTNDTNSVQPKTKKRCINDILPIQKLDTCTSDDERKVVTDVIWNELNIYIPFEKFRTKSDQKEYWVPLCETFCWKLRNPKISWKDLPLSFAVNPGTARHALQRLKTRSDYKRYITIEKILHKANSNPKSSHKNVEPFFIISDDIWSALESILPTDNVSGTRIKNRQFMEAVAWKLYYNIPWTDLLQSRFGIQGENIGRKWKNLGVLCKQIEPILLKAIQEIKYRDQ
ncbi:MAG TPA: hypothetical protein VGW78_03780 [Candidatus Babeliales bacterium]|jgi:hypothetical protein|nr:hypothetical protein [Candidatus Babeliales bacterium]